MFLAFDDEEHLKQEGFADELESLKEELKNFLCAHQRVVTTEKLLKLLSKMYNFYFAIFFHFDKNVF